MIYCSGNGVAEVDDEWFSFAADGEILGVPVRLCPAEEMIWSKAYVQERERFDGADIAHLIRCRGKSMDWDRLLRRFGDHWRVLFSHLVLFGFIYPGDRRDSALALDRAGRSLRRTDRKAITRWASVLRHSHLARAISPRYRHVGLPRRAVKAGRLHVTRRGRALDGGDRRAQNLTSGPGGGFGGGDRREKSIRQPDRRQS